MESLLVDAAAICRALRVEATAVNFVRRTGSFDGVVASNLFGDILSDLSAIVTGGIGFTPSASLDSTRRFPSV
jgi:tartrate dehydrogenase/decarboxylase/D-malate dehydrogenase